MNSGESPPSLDGLEMVKRIGRGSYGEVWLARGVTGGWRAVKVLWRERFEEARPFEREFEGIQKYEPISRDHPHLVHVLHAGMDEAKGCFHYVMELADDRSGAGGVDPETYLPRTLRHELRKRGAMPAGECVRVGRALAAALVHLHGHGLIHRDLKPSNVIFIYGEPKLADLGLVTGEEDTKSFVGTMGYLPKEGPGTAAADLYALGIVMYEMLSGRDRHDFPTLPLELFGPEADALAHPLNQIILKTCANNPAQRYATASELVDDLERLTAGRTTCAAREEQREMWSRRAIAAVVVLAVAGVIYWAMNGAPESKPGQFRDHFDKAGAHWKYRIEFAEPGDLVDFEGVPKPLTAEMLAEARAASHAKIENGKLKLKINKDVGWDFGQTFARLDRPLPENFALHFKVRKTQWAGHFRVYLCDTNTFTPGPRVFFGFAGSRFKHLSYNSQPTTKIETDEAVLAEPLLNTLTVGEEHAFQILRTEKSLRIFHGNQMLFRHDGKLPPLPYLMFVCTEAGAEVEIDAVEVVPYQAN